MIKARLQQYVNCELPDVQAGFRKGRGIAFFILPESFGSSKKQESSRNTSISSLLTTPKPLTVWIIKIWKILKEMGIVNHLTCLLRNLYAGQEATVRTRHGEAGKVVWYSISFRIFQFVVIHTVKGFGIVNKAEINVFLEFPCFFDDPAEVGNLIFDSSAFSKTSLSIRKFMVHVLLKPDLENFEHYFNSVWNEYNCAVVWVFFGIAFLWDWNENWPFPVLWPLLLLSNLLAYWVQHFDSIIFQDLKQLNWNSITSTSFVCSA